MELWNKRFLISPPISSVRTNMTREDVERFKSIFEDAAKVLKVNEIFMKEVEIFSRIIYKAKTRYRGHKGFSFLGKVNQGLQRYISLNLGQIYSTFIGCFNYHDDTQHFSLPTKQNLQYLLVRTQGFAKLMYFVATSCQDAAFHFRSRIVRGITWKDNLVLFGVISRIWYFVRYLALCACELYSKLLPFLEKLDEHGVCWLPDSYKFPKDLKEWLGPDLLSDNSAVQNADVYAICQDFSQENFMDFSADIGELVSREDLSAISKSQVLSSRNAVGVSDNSLTEDADSMNYSNMSLSRNSDLQREIQRERFPRARPPKIIRLKNIEENETSSEHSGVKNIQLSMKTLKKIRTERDVKALLDSENGARLKGVKCFTRYLADSQWRLLVNEVESILKNKSSSSDKNLLPLVVITKIKQSIKSFMK